MNQITYNGRVNIAQPDINKQFAMYDRIPVTDTTSFSNALQGNWDKSPLSIAFFSQQNIQILQNAIRAGVYKLSKEQYLIAPQSVDTLKIIMRSIFLQNSANMPAQITKQIEALNQIVVEYCIKQVYGEAQGYITYLHDASTLVVPIQRPVMSNTNNKTLELKNFF
jgi:hypothetical protein